MKLYNRGSSYYTILTIPRCLVSEYGKKQIWKSLRTNDYKLAKLRAEFETMAIRQKLLNDVKKIKAQNQTADLYFDDDDEETDDIQVEDKMDFSQFSDEDFLNADDKTISLMGNETFSKYHKIKYAYDKKMARINKIRNSTIEYDQREAEDFAYDWLLAKAQHETKRLQNVTNIVESKDHVYIPPEKIIKDIINNENLLNEKKKPIISKEILQHKIFIEENKKEIKEDAKVWWGNAKEPQKLREELKNQGCSDFQLCIQLFSSLGCFRKEEAKQEFDISLLNTFIDMSCFCSLLAYGIVRKEENKYIIDTRKPEQQNFTLEADDIKKAYDVYLKPDKQKGETFVLLAYTDEFVKKIYFDLCRYYISDKDQNSTEIYSSKRADILRALKILEKLGLVRTQTTNDQFIYSHYVPRYYFEGKWIYD